MPDDETDSNAPNTSEQFVEDQTDVDARIIADGKAAQASELARRSQVVQKDLPRPLEINSTILRPPNETDLTEMQRAEELIKQEMVTMLHYDAMLNPVPYPAHAPPKKPTSLQQLQSYLTQNPYDQFDDDELEEAKEMLKEEMHVVKNGMGHSDLSVENYSQVWEECLSQVLYLPSQMRYTRANLASKKDRFDSLEKRLEQNRRHMAKEAKRCAKTEKKLKILTGGYQVRTNSSEADVCAISLIRNVSSSIRSIAGKSTSIDKTVARDL